MEGKTVSTPFDARNDLAEWRKEGKHVALIRRNQIARRLHEAVCSPGPRSSVPHHSHPLSRCVDVDVASRMLSENFDGAPFVLSIPSPHP
jgi:hypothetical protein